MRRFVALVTVAALACPGLSYGSSAEARSDVEEAKAGQDAGQPAPQLDASKLGVSLERIRHGLAVAESRETVSTNGQRLNIRVEVFGQAPPLDLLTNKDFSLVFGPVPNSAPTHREFIDFVTPQEFRAPAVPIFGLAIWAAQKIADRAKKSRCEQEIEEYRQLIMQGVPVAAPRCTQ